MRVLILSILIISCSGKNASLYGLNSGTKGTDALTNNTDTSVPTPEPADNSLTINAPDKVSTENATNVLIGGNCNHDDDESVEVQVKNDNGDLLVDSSFECLENNTWNMDPLDLSGEDGNIIITANQNNQETVNHSINLSNDELGYVEITTAPTDVFQAQADSVTLSGRCEPSRADVTIDISAGPASQTRTIPCNEDGTWTIDTDLSTHVGDVNVNASQVTDSGLVDQTNTDFIIKENPPTLGLVTINDTIDTEQTQASSLVFTGECSQARGDVLVSIKSGNNEVHTETVTCLANGSWATNAVDLSQHSGSMTSTASQKVSPVSDILDSATETFNISESDDSGDDNTDLHITEFAAKSVSPDTDNLDQNGKPITADAVLGVITNKDAKITSLTCIKAEDNGNDPQPVSFPTQTFSNNKEINVDDLEIGKQYIFVITMVDEQGNEKTTTTPIIIEENTIKDSQTDTFKVCDVNAPEAKTKILVKGGVDYFTFDNTDNDHLNMDQDYVNSILKERSSRVQSYGAEHKAIGFDYNYSNGDNDMITFAQFDLNAYKGKIECIEAEIKGKVMKEYHTPKNHSEEVFTTVWWKTDSINFKSADETLKISYKNILLRNNLYYGEFDPSTASYANEEARFNAVFDKFWTSANIFTKSIDLTDLKASINESGELIFHYEDDAVLDYIKLKIVLK